MLGGLLVMGGLGVVIGVGLALASKIFYVYVDPKIEAVGDALPGANCGGCGLPGCASNAAAIVEHRATADSCVAGGPEVAAEIAQILGVEVVVREPDFARLGCTYGFHEADVKFIYDGVNDCRAAAMLGGGAKVCPIGCVGLGTCVRACPFDALSMGPDNLPVVNLERCTGCGTCARICPKQIVTLSSGTRRIISEYVTDECTAPCQRTCPTGIDIPGFIKEISLGNYEEALFIIKEKCPLPLVCGYICPAPCESECRRNMVEDGIAINPLKRFVADHEMSTGKHKDPFRNPDNDRKIALVGGGTEGLTIGYYLARLGYKPTIFEAKPELGGILRYVIAEDRLPRRVLDHEIKGILDAGVEAKTNMVMGRDFSMSTLMKEGYEAVLLSSGGFDSRKILQPEQKRYDGAVHGVFIMLDFLTALAQGEKVDIGKRVAFTGAGAKELELARKCLKNGAEKVTLLTNQPLSSLPLEIQDVNLLLGEGIEVRTRSIVKTLKGASEQLQQIVLESRDSLGGEDTEETTVDVDTLILSSGRIPELIFVRPPSDPESETPSDSESVPLPVSAAERSSDLQSERSSDPGSEGDDRWETLETFRTFPKSGDDGLFSSPEPGRISDASAVVKAILSGRRLARSVHQYFTEEEITPIERLTCEAGTILNVSEVHNVEMCARQRPSLTDVEGDSKTAWIFPTEFPGLDESSARLEAERCLQCGLICYKRAA